MADRGDWDLQIASTMRLIAHFSARGLDHFGQSHLGRAGEGVFWMCMMETDECVDSKPSACSGKTRFDTFIGSWNSYGESHANGAFPLIILMVDSCWLMPRSAWRDRVTFGITRPTAFSRHSGSMARDKDLMHSGS